VDTQEEGSHLDEKGSEFSRGVGDRGVMPFQNSRSVVAEQKDGGDF